MIANRYSSLINPHKSEVEQIEIEVLAMLHRGDNRWRGNILRTTLRYFLKTFQFGFKTGFITMEETVRSRSGNCISLGCLLASTMMKLQISNTAVFAGCHIWQPARIHAYVVLPGEEHGQITVIDPEFMKPLPVSLERFCARYRVFLIFNDRTEAVTADAKIAWLNRLAKERENGQTKDAHDTASAAISSGDRETLR